MILEKEIRDGFKISEEIMKERGKSFYKAFKYLPKDRFKAITAIYAYCRYADDLVDNDLDEKSNSEIDLELTKLELSVKSLFNNEENEEIKNYKEKFPWWKTFEYVVKKYNVTEYSLLNQLKGQRMDFKFKDIKNTDELIQYSKYVAGSVGLMLLPILITNKELHDDTEMKKSCEDLGVGMQITNILRDVGEDLKTRDRLYLPKDRMDYYNVKREELENLAKEKNGEDLQIPKEFINLWEELADLADKHYEGINKHINEFHITSRFPLLAASYIYHEIAEEVRKNNYDCFTKRAYTSDETKKELSKKAMEDLKNL